MQHRALTVCPVLIGREWECGQLRAALEAATTGAGGCTLLSGEAGVGKSRLVSELVANAEAGDWATVRVSCLEADIGEPYALALQLAQLLDGTPLPFQTAPEAERQARRVEQALRDRIERYADDRPLLLVAEDIHWSDQPSLHALLGLIHRPGRWLFALTYRPEPLQPALAGFLAELARLRLVREIELAPLRRAEVARMVRATLAFDEQVTGALLDEIVSATEGVPFLVEEVLRSLIESGGLERDGRNWRRCEGVPLRTPGSLRQAIDARLLTQPIHVRRVAMLAAAIGQAPALDVLRPLCDLDDATLLQALRMLVDAQILVVRPDGHPAFRHALTREAILARLLTPERQQLHREVAEVLTRDPATPAATLAYHLAQAGQPRLAGPHALRAAREAAVVHAHREAIGHYHVALAGQAAPEAELLTALGDHHTHLSECEAAVSRYRQAMQPYVATGDHTRIAELALRIGIAYATQRRRTEARRYLVAALEGLPPGHPDRWRAGRELALQLAAQGLFREAEATLYQAREDGAATGALARLRIEHELGGVLSVQGDWAALERAALATLRDTAADPGPGDADEVLALRHDAEAVLGEIALYRGDMVRSLSHHQACLDLATRRGLLHEQALARWSIAMKLYYLGRWDEAHTELAEVQALGGAPIGELVPPFEHRIAGRLEEAVACWLDTWGRFEVDVDFELLVAIALYSSEALLAVGRYDEVRDRLDTLLTRIRCTGALSYEFRLAPLWAEALARLADPRAATVCDDTLVLVRRLGAPHQEALALRARAWSRRTAGDWSGAFGDCDASLAILDRLGIAWEAAQTLRLAGELRLARGRRGDRERARTALDEARQRFAAIGIERDCRDVMAILSRAGLPDLPPDDDPLSPREREVAKLAALGLTNREIAERLVITEKTASHHVSAILTKLGLGSRVEVAAHIARHG